MKTHLAVIRLILFLSSPVMADDAASDVVSTDVLRGTHDAIEDQQPIQPYHSCAGTSSVPIRVVFDISRDKQMATVYEGSKIVNQYRVSGGRDKYEYNDKEGWVCSYSSVGEFQPVQLNRIRYSGAHNNAPMPWYVDLDSPRVMGAHEGTVGKMSGACIHQGYDKKGHSNAQWLYSYIQSHSKMDGDWVVCSDVTISVIDNTLLKDPTTGKMVPVSELRKKCFARIGKADPVHTLPVAPIPLPRPIAQPTYATGDPLPADHFVQVKFDQQKYDAQYKYLDKGPYPQALPTTKFSKQE